MRRNIFLGIMLSVMVAFMSPITAMSHGDHHDKHQGDMKAGKVYTCPMHPDVQADKPGKCPKCGMALVLDTKHAATPTKVLSKKQIAEIKAGTDYNCCIKHPCNRCAIDHQNCSCSMDVKSGVGICSECYAGWHHGQGAVPGIDAKKVKLGSHTH